MKKIVLIIMTALLLTSCESAADKTKKPVIYSSFYAMDSFVRVIGGEDIVHHSIVPVGSEPHDFEPAARDMAKMADADLFVYNGAGIDSWAEAAAKTLPETAEIVCASDNLALKLEDPHDWLYCENAQLQIEAIRDALCRVDEANKEKYYTRWEQYAALIAEVEKEYDSAGLEGRKLFVTHGAYGYLCHTTGMEQIALEGISGESDPSPAQMAQIVGKIKAEGAKCIFYDPLEGDKLAAAVAREADIEALPLYTFEGDPEHRDYVETMKLNLEQLKKGLQL